MILSNRQKRACKAFSETANLVALSIVLVPGLLTLDPWLLGGGTAFELGYLFIATFCWRPYLRRVESREESGKDTDPLDPALLVVSVIGAIIIMFFGFFGKHLLSYRLFFLTRAQGWEAGAIIWTFVFIGYYYFKVDLTRSGWDKLIFPLFPVAGIVSLGLAFWFMFKDPATHVICIFVSGLCLLLIDLVICKKHPHRREKELSKRSLIAADIPTVGAFLVLILYLCFDGGADKKDVFVSGVVAYQVLVSNAVFIVMEFGLLGPPKDPTLNNTPASGQQLTTTFNVTGRKYTPNGTVHRFVRFPNGTEQKISSIIADRLGHVSWTFAPGSSDQPGTNTVWAVDEATGRRSNDVTQSMNHKA
jgi:hypothetical protein